MADEDKSDESTILPPPQMSPWNGALRFSLELAALVGIGHFGYHVVPSASALTSWTLAIGLPLTAAVMWGVFNVPDDPSRSGTAPVPISGWKRLVIEFAILGWGGGYGLGVDWNPIVGFVFLGLCIVHYATYPKRIQWLLLQQY